MKKILIILTIFIVFLNYACKKEKELPEEVTALIKDTLAATERKDLDEIKKRLHPNSPYYGASIDALKLLFSDRIEIKYKILSIKPVKMTEELITAKASLIITMKRDNEQYKPSKSIFTYTLKKYGEEWKIFQSIIDQYTTTQ